MKNTKYQFLSTVFLCLFFVIMGVSSCGGGSSSGSNAAGSSTKDITQFTILDIDGTIGSSTVALTVPYGTDVTDLTPTIVHNGASVSPESGVTHDFSSPAVYTVTAEDGSTKDYTVTVSAALKSSKEITRFTILGIDGTIGTSTITLTVPYGTDVKKLTPTITITGKSVSPASGVEHDFTGSATYTVTAADASTQAYTVTVSLAPPKVITAFDFATPAATGIVDETSHTIAITVPFGTDVTKLVPTISYLGTDVSPASGVLHDFTDPAMYTVTAADSSQQGYIVTVTVAPDMAAKAITSFTFDSPPATGIINETLHTIAITVPFGTIVTGLIPTITHTGAKGINPASGVAHSFSSPATYTVTAQDNSTQDYTVTVTVAANSARAITSFTFASPAATGIINETLHTIAVTVPYLTNVTALVPTITHTGASINPVSGAAHNFSSPATYTVTAGNASTQDYTVTVTVALNPAKAITSFTFASPAATGTITEITHSIAITVPYVDVTALVPTITHTGASINPASGVAHNFTSPATYTVTAADASSQAYTVTVTIDPSIPSFVTASYLTVSSGSVVYKGKDPASTTGTDMTMTFKSDGTFTKVWHIPNIGDNKTTTGTWSYDTNHVLTLYHTGTFYVFPVNIKITTTELYYNSGFVYDNGNKLTFSTFKQTSTAPHGGEFGSTIIGTFSTHVNVNVKVPIGGVNDTMDTVGTTTVISGNPFPWNSSTVTSTNGTAASPVTANGTLAIPADVWLFKIGTDYFIQTDTTYVLTKQ